MIAVCVYLWFEQYVIFSCELFQQIFYVNNKDTDQPVQFYSLINVLVMLLKLQFLESKFSTS